MTDVLFVVVTLAAFAGLALLVGLLDHADRRATQRADR